MTLEIKTKYFIIGIPRNKEIVGDLISYFWQVQGTTQFDTYYDAEQAIIYISEKFPDVLFGIQEYKIQYDIYRYPQF